MAFIFHKVVIVGPGMIGGSVGLALHRIKGADRIVGVGRRESSIRTALDVGAIDEGSLSLEEAVKEANLVILATAVGLIPKLATRALPHMMPGSILTDVGSTKAAITREIEIALDDLDVSFVGAHPLAGSEQRGIEAARADLFQGSTCIITPTPKTPPWAVEKVAGLWQALGATVRYMPPDIHDAILAEISHLPHLVAAALVNSVSDEALAYAARGFLDTTRVASGDPELWRDICLTNRAPLAAALRKMEASLAEWARAVEIGDSEALLHLLARAKERREQRMRAKENRP